MKKNSLAFLALTVLTITTCTNNLHALTKTKTLAQAATTVANYARKNKFKTAGIIIGGAIALDYLRTCCNKTYYGRKLKAANQLVEQKHKEALAAWDTYWAQHDFRTGGDKAHEATADQRAKADAAHTAWNLANYEELAAEKAHNLIERKFRRGKVTYLYVAYWRIAQKINKFRGH